MGSSVQPVPLTPDDAAFQQWKAAKSGSPAQTPTTTHDDAQFQAWKEQQGNGAKPGVLGTIQKGVEALVSGVPGAQRAVAGYRGLLSLLTGEGLDAASKEVQNAMSGQQKDVASLPGIARIPLQLTGAAPVAAALAPLGVLGGGAAFGAMAGADKPAETMEDRLKNIGVGTAFGAAGAKGGQLLGKGIANVADRTGLTDLAGRALSKVAPNLSATLGTEGQVNKVLGDRQDILDHIGDTGETGASQQLARIANSKAQAKTLYDAARQDTQIIQDPELQQLLADPQIQKTYQTAAALRAASGNPLPRAAVPDQVPLALQKMGVSPERYAELQALNQSRRIGISGTEALPPELLGEQAQGVEMPDPDVLAKTKRMLWDKANGLQDSPLAMKQEEAQALLPKVDMIRQKLHSLSPSWQQADQFYAGAKGEEEAFSHGFDAFKLANNQNGENLATNSPEAMLKAIEEPRYPSEPPEAMAARASAFRAGAKAAASGQVKGADVDRGLNSILRVNALEPTQPGMQTRSLMFDQPTDATTLESTLARLRGQSMAQPSAGGGNNPPPVSHFGAVRYLARKVMQTPDLLETPQGQQTLMSRLANPEALQQGVSAFRSTYSPFTTPIPGLNKLPSVTGRPEYGMSDFLARVLGIDAGGQIAR